MNATHQRDIAYRNRSLLDLANGAPCMRCGAQDGTTVAAHSNFQEHGRGFSYKSHDIFIAFLCGACHYFMDAGKGSREDKKSEFNRAMHATWLYCWRNGKVRVA